MIYLILIVILGVKFIPFFLDCPSLYFAGQDFLIILLLYNMKKKDTLTKILAALLIGFTSFFFFCEVLDIQAAFIASPVITFVLLSVLFVSFRGRFSFDKLDTDVYEKSKVQMVVKEPKRIIPLIGAARFFDPFGSVFYTCNGYKMYYCAKTNKLEIKKFAPSKKYKYFDTQITADQFFTRYHQMTNKRYNIIKNNCRSIFPNPKQYVKWK